MTIIANAAIAQSLEDCLNAHVLVALVANVAIRTAVKTAHVLMAAVVRGIRKKPFVFVLKVIRESVANKICAAVGMAADVCQLSQSMDTTLAYVGPTLWALFVKFLSRNLVMKLFVITEVSADSLKTTRPTVRVLPVGPVPSVR